MENKNPIPLHFLDEWHPTLNEGLNPPMLSLPEATRRHGGKVQSVVMNGKLLSLLGHAETARFLSAWEEKSL